MSSPLPPVWPTDPLPEIRRLRADELIVVLDDDPTGTQTVRGATVMTKWSEDALVEAFCERLDLLFLLTNSRSMPQAQALELASASGFMIRSAAVRTGRRVAIISRSDSTLRGHFPAEVDALAASLGLSEPRVLLAPFLGIGGRITLANTHFVVFNGRPVPVADTEYAQDPVFGYRSSNLVDWVHEKTRDARPVIPIPLETSRQQGPSGVAAALEEGPSGAVYIVNAVEERDIEVVALGALQAESRGLALVPRTAASFVRARAGQPQHPLLRAADLQCSKPGVVVVGSHVSTTTVQLKSLLESSLAARLRPIELDVRRVAAGEGPSLRRVLARSMTVAIKQQRIPIVYTSRSRLSRGSGEADLALARSVSTVLSGAVADLEADVGWVITKGGITSSDVATLGLGMVRAQVLGQILPGVSVWRLGESYRPGLLIGVFPGNVGSPISLFQAVEMFMAGL
jgi:uncharacterized protein YgbK (DUF1537 family)